MDEDEEEASGMVTTAVRDVLVQVAKTQQPTTTAVLDAWMNMDEIHRTLMQVALDGRETEDARIGAGLSLLGMAREGMLSPHLVVHDLMAVAGQPFTPVMVRYAWITACGQMQPEWVAHVLAPGTITSPETVISDHLHVMRSFAALKLLHSEDALSQWVAMIPEAGSPLYHEAVHAMRSWMMDAPTEVTTLAQLALDAKGVEPLTRLMDDADVSLEMLDRLNPSSHPHFPSTVLHPVHRSKAGDGEMADRS